MKYTAINIGPILSTLGMARKPRELWAASYMFSHLARCIYKEVEKVEGVKIISPKKPETESNKVGIYPDRIYVKGEFDAKTVLKAAYSTFFVSLYNEDWNKIDLSYFNLMSASCKANKDSLAIKDLNQKLDVIELCNYATNGNPSGSIYSLISDWKKSPLFTLVGKRNTSFPYSVNKLEEIATAELRGIDKKCWDEACDYAEEKEKEEEKKENAFSEDYFYKNLATKEPFKKKIKSHHKYICVVQADGDNVGKTVSHKDLEDDDLEKISTALVKFGCKSAELIEEYGGLPIYAGGDDLLFIAPVIGVNGKNIFNLIDKIENEAFKYVVDEVERCGKNENGIFIDGNKIEASLSFGISITYYKYPLYEALESAKSLLFGTAKRIKQKKAVAWSFRKHSGGTFNAAFTRKVDGADHAGKKTLTEAFTQLIEVSKDKEMVSAISHKVQQNETLVDLALDSYNNGQTNRLKALFENILEGGAQKTAYFEKVKELMPILYNIVEKDKYPENLFCMLRTARFINGEEISNE